MACVFTIVMACSIFLLVTAVCKNGDVIAGWPVPPLLICRGGAEVFAAQKAVAYTDLLALVLDLYSRPSNKIVSHFEEFNLCFKIL